MEWLMRMLSKTKKKRHGFTLIELMVVLIIIAILAVAAVPTYMYFVHRAYEAEAAASLGAIKTAQIVYWAEHGEYAKIWGLVPGGLGMTTADFAQNKWFHDGCFGLVVTNPDTDFNAICYGLRDGDSKVEDIKVYLSKDSDIQEWTVISGVTWLAAAP